MTMSDFSTLAGWQREQAVYATPEQQAALRKALLQRIADRLAYARALESGAIEGGCWPCCWLTYDRPKFGDPTRTEAWLYRLCDPVTCVHFHHETEVFLA